MSKIIEKIGNVYTMMIGLFIYMLSNIQVSFWTIDVTICDIIINSIIRGISISIFYVPLANITYTSLPAKLRTDGASLFQFLRTLGTGSSVAIFINLLNRFEAFHFENIRNSLVSSKIRNLSFFESEYLMANDKSHLYNIIINYSLMNSIINDFLVLAVIPLIFFPFFYLFKSK